MYLVRMFSNVTMNNLHMHNCNSFCFIALVYGGADYNKILPPKSFIDVKDFKSPSLYFI